jgi:sugar phosphate isomerase/epimerase
MHLPLKSTPEQRKEVTAKFAAAEITALSCGVVAMPNKEETIKQAFEYARDAGIPTIVISPAPEALPLIEKYVKEFNIPVAIHNHGPEDKTGFHAPADVWAAVEKLDERVGLCIDVGHTSKAGADPAESIRKFASRLHDVHFKDVADKGPKAKTVECGRGVLDIRGMFQALLDIKYAHAVSFEFEKDADDPLPGLAETVGYCKGVISDMAAK